MRSRIKRHATFWVYMVQCADGAYYTGSTTNLETRLKLHNAGNGAKYLRGRGPVRLVYAKAYGYYKNALRAESYLKRQTRTYKDELIKAHGVRTSSS